MTGIQEKYIDNKRRKRKIGLKATKKWNFQEILHKKKLHNIYKHYNQIFLKQRQENHMLSIIHGLIYICIRIYVSMYVMGIINLKIP